MEQENNMLLKNENIVVDDQDIKNLIYTIRGKQVMLDSDVAMLYHCTLGTQKMCDVHIGDAKDVRCIK